MTDFRHKLSSFVQPSGGTACRKWLKLAGLTVAILWTHQASAGVLAGDIISNMAVGEYKEEGSNVVQTSRSNLVQTTILPVYAATLVADRSQNAQNGQTIQFPHVLTNTGNITDTYNLSTQNLTSDSFDVNNIKIYADANQDGVADNINNLSSITLAPGQSTGLIVEAQVPITGTTGVVLGNSAKLSLVASSTNNNTLSLNNTDTVTLSNSAIVIVTKSFFVQNGTTYVRFDYANQSSMDSGQVILTDTLPASLSYQSGKETWRGTALNPASGSNDPSGIDYYLDTDGRTVKATLTSIPANSTGNIQFAVNVVQTTAGAIFNTVNVSYDHDNNTSTANISTTSNTASWNIAPIYRVVLNANASNTNNSGSDDQVTAASITAGDEVSFTNYVWNTGNTEDRFNLTINSDNFPTPHQVEFYRADGVTPLLDSNGDGIPDTGNLPAGGMLPIVVKVRLPTTNEGATGTVYTVVPKAQSLGDSTQSDTVTNNTSIAATNISVDLTNGPETSNNGIGNGATTNNGNAWKTLTGKSNGQVVFPLTVKHTGAATAYQFAADGDGDFSKLELPTGIASVRYFDSTSVDCSTLGNEIGQTRLLKNGESQAYCAVVKLKNNTATLTNVPIYFKVSSATYQDTNTSGFDTLKNAININTLNAVGTVSFDPDLRGQITPGGTIVYTHTLYNYTKTALTGSYQLVTQHDQPGFTSTYYLDSNANGQFDSTDTLLDPTNISGSLFPATSQVRIFAKVQSPVNAPVGMIDTASIQFKTSTGTVLDTATDITRVTTTQLRLYKLQAKDDDCNGQADSSYTTSGLTIGRNTNGTGQCVLYRVTVKNEGATAIGQFNFRDATPAATAMEFAPTCASCTSGSIVAPAKGASGTLSGQLPSVAPNSSYNFEFGVRYVGQ